MIGEQNTRKDIVWEEVKSEGGKVYKIGRPKDSPAKPEKKDGDDDKRTEGCLFRDNFEVSVSWELDANGSTNDEFRKKMGISWYSLYDNDRFADWKLEIDN